MDLSQLITFKSKCMFYLCNYGDEPEAEVQAVENVLKICTFGD